MPIRNNLIIILLLMSICSSCSKKQDKLKDTINILTETDTNLKISETIKEQNFSVNELKTIKHYNTNSKHYGNVIIKGINKKKLKKTHTKKYSNKKTDLPFFIKPLIIKDHIYLIDTNGKLVAYNKKNKKTLWKNNLEDSLDTYNSLKGGINFHKQNLYVAIGSNKIFKINKETGQTIWKKTFDSLIRSIPYIHNDKIYISALNNSLYCLSIKDGKIIWQNSFLDSLSSQFGNSGVNSRGFIISLGNSSGEIIVIDGEKGEIIWKDNIGSINVGVEHFNFYDIDSFPIIYDKKLYSVSSNGNMAAFEYISGVKLWERKLSSRKTPWVTKELVFVIDNNNNLIALSRNSGKIKWYRKLNQEIHQKKEEKFFYGPVVINGQVFVSSNVGRLVAFDYNSGEISSKYKIPKNINHFPIIENDRMYMLNNKSVLYEYK